jgi:hypothetical protein
MTITYQTEDQFYNGIYQLVLKGLTFEANGDKLSITLLGGY